MKTYVKISTLLLLLCTSTVFSQVNPSTTDTLKRTAPDTLQREQRDVVVVPVVPVEEVPRVYLGARYMPTFANFKTNTVNGLAQTSFTLGNGVGGYMGVNFSRHVGMQLEVIYSELSQKYTYKSQDYRVDLNYLYIPLLLVLNTDVTKPVNLNITAGPQVGINTGSNVKGPSNSNDSVTAVLAVKPVDLGVAYGAGLDFRLNRVITLDVGFRGMLGLLDISNNSQTTTTNEYYILDRSKVRTYAGYAGIKFNF